MADAPFDPKVHPGEPEWLREVVEYLRTRAQQVEDPAEYWDGVRTAAARLQEMIGTMARRTVEPERFWTEFGKVDPADEASMQVVRAIVGNDVGFILPPRAEMPEGIRQGIHIPLVTSLLEGDSIINEPEIVVTPQDSPAPLLEPGRGQVFNFDLAVGKVYLRDEPSSPLHVAEFAGTVAVDAGTYTEAALVHAAGVDLFGPSAPLSSQTLAYRLAPSTSRPAADALIAGHRLFREDKEFGLLWQNQLNGSIQAAVEELGPRAGAQDLFAVMEGALPTPTSRGDVGQSLRGLSAAALPSREEITITVPRPVTERRVLSAEREGSIWQDHVTVLAQIALPGEPLGGARHSDEFDADLSQQVIIDISAVGFTTRDPTWVPVTVPPGKPSIKIACQFTPEDVPQHSITVVARQGGATLGRVHFDDFVDDSATASRPLRDDYAAFDVLIKVDDDGTVHLTSHDGKQLGTVLGKKIPHRDGDAAKLDSRVRAVLRQNRDDDDIDFDLREIGHRVADSMPDQLVNFLKARSGNAVLIEHPMDMTFPFELAMLDTADGHQLLGEVHQVTRWISTTGSELRDSVPPITKAAFVWGSNALANLDDGRLRHLKKLQALCTTESYDKLADVRKDVLMSDRYGVVDFVTHMKQRDYGMGLEIGADWLGSGDFFDPYATFAGSVALVFLNACDSMGTDQTVFDPKSFPDELIRRHVPAVIASYLPVEPVMALRFGDYLFDELASSHALGEAMVNARRRLQNDDELGCPARRRMATAAYCAFGHPRMTFKFS